MADVTREQQLADAKAWLCRRWNQKHPNAQHVIQLADYAQHLATNPIPAAPPVDAVPVGAVRNCPFCGGKGDIESQPSYDQAAATYSRHRVWCDQCGFGLEWHNYEPDAVAAWNVRASSCAVAQPIDAVREAATGVLARWDGAYPLTMVEAMDNLRTMLAAAPTPLASTSAQADGVADMRDRCAKVAEEHGWRNGKMAENSCCVATACDIAAVLRTLPLTPAASGERRA